jgi:hypothetical protein
MLGMEGLLTILVIVAIVMIGRRLFESEDTRAAREIEKRKESAKKKGITRQAVFIAKQLGERDRDGWYVYKDSELRIIADQDSVGVKKASDDTVVFKAGYTDIPVYEYRSGTSLERQEDGSYDVVHETGLGGGFTEKILGYIPGDWERHFRVLGQRATDKQNSERLQREQTKKEQTRKSFGI